MEYLGQASSRMVVLRLSKPQLSPALAALRMDGLGTFCLLLCVAVPFIWAPACRINAKHTGLESQKPQRYKNQF